jgi:titin
MILKNHKKLKVIVMNKSIDIRNLYLIVLAFLLFSDHVYADIYSVTNTNDSGAGSLRQAILDANNQTEPDTITFNIAQTDPNFNGQTWTIQPLSELPALDDTSGGTFLDGTTQTLNGGNTNPLGPEIEINGASTSSGADGLTIQSSNNKIRGFIINGFKFFFPTRGDGILILGSESTNNIIVGNYIGTDFSGSSATSNEGNGITIIDASSNYIGGSTIDDRNLISGNELNGILIDGDGARNNVVSGNLIGTNISGTMALPNLDNGIEIWEADSNLIGGSTPEYRNIISGNDRCGIWIVYGSHNTINNNFIGTDTSGSFAIPNMSGGIGVSLAPFNTIGGDGSNDGNLISGNHLEGISIFGESASNNKISGNLIGTDITGTSAIPNRISGIKVDKGDSNTIGGSSLYARNIISGNLEDGIKISSNSNNNKVLGNYIGTDVSGTIAINNELSGIGISDSHFNIIGGILNETGNLISGNNRSGIFITELSGNGIENLITGNLIGTDITGTVAIPNGGASGAGGGIWLLGASENTIGGSEPGLRNIISGNTGFGIMIQLTSAIGNTVIGNYIGVDISGTQALGNSEAGVDILGAKNHHIERNIISGNLEGINIRGRQNYIIGNYIGTDASGSVAIPNNKYGIAIEEIPFFVGGGRLNIIGGENINERNIISANMNHGIYIEHADSNSIIGNYIGVDNTGQGMLGNHGDGIHITVTAVPPLTPPESNTIGPNNVIAFNLDNGINIWPSGAIMNTITQNSITTNDGVGILLRDNANAGIQPPVINSVSAISGDSIEVIGTAIPNSTIEFFSDPIDEGKFYEGNYVISGPSSNFVWRGTVRDSMITATVTDTNGNTSEFSLPSITGVISEDILSDLPTNFQIEQNYPNPFNPTTIIRYDLPKTVKVSLNIYNILGQEVHTLVNEKQPAGEKSVVWDGRDRLGREVSSGIYIYKIQAGNYVKCRKMVLIR